MSSDFATIVEEVKKLPNEDKEELRCLLEKYLIAERREEIFQNYKKSLDEHRKNELKFSDSTKRLKEMISE